MGFFSDVILGPILFDLVLQEMKKADEQSRQLAADRATLIALARRLEKIFCGKRNEEGKNEGADLVDVKKRLKSLRTKAKIKYNYEGKISLATYVIIRDDLYKRYIEIEDHKYLQQLFKPITFLMIMGDGLTVEILNKQLKLIKHVCGIVGGGVSKKCVLLKNEIVKNKFKDLAKKLPEKIEEKTETGFTRRQTKSTEKEKLNAEITNFELRANQNNYKDIFKSYNEMYKGKGSDGYTKYPEWCSKIGSALKIVFNGEIQNSTGKKFVKAYNKIVSLLGDTSSKLEFNNDGTWPYNVEQTSGILGDICQNLNECISWIGDINQKKEIKPNGYDRNEKVEEILKHINTIVQEEKGQINSMTLDKFPVE